jgi:hypothetical protein
MTSVTDYSPAVVNEYLLASPQQFTFTPQQFTFTPQQSVVPPPSPPPPIPLPQFTSTPQLTAPRPLAKPLARLARTPRSSRTKPMKPITTFEVSLWPFKDSEPPQLAGSSLSWTNDMTSVTDYSSAVVNENLLTYWPYDITQGTETPSKKFKCMVCDKMFSQPANVRTHVRNVHEKIKHTCLLCDAKLSSKTNLDHHMKKTHATPGMYRALKYCTICKLHMRGDLARHEHTRKHQCALIASFLV